MCFFLILNSPNILNSFSSPSCEIRFHIFAYIRWLVRDEDYEREAVSNEIEETEKMLHT